MCQEYSATGQDTWNRKHGRPHDQALARTHNAQARQGLNLDLREGRSEKAARLHSVAASSRKPRDRDPDGEPSAAVAGGDFWSERGERGRWVRVHVTPRSDMFFPEEAPRGPGRKTRLRATRKVQGEYLSGVRFKKENDWTTDNPDDSLEEPWTGRTIFIVDRLGSPDFGTDQRRQRIEASAKRRVSWADMSD